VCLVLSKSPTWNDVLELRTKLKDTNIKYWFNENVFTFPWWVLLIGTVIFIIFWWRFLDKSRISEILLYGFMATTLIMFLDVVGTSALLWGYPNMLFPLVPPVIAIDIGHLPIIYMMIYQYFQSWKSFFIAMTIGSLIISFVFEPTAVCLGIYEMNNWKHIYSFPIYILIGVFFKWLIIKIKNLESNKKKSN
jgi:hypothetical protein